MTKLLQHTSADFHSHLLGNSQTIPGQPPQTNLLIASQMGNLAAFIHD